LGRLGRYIERNPVRAEIADDLEIFSSSRKSIFIGVDSFRNSLIQSKGRTSARKKGKP
jgi:hypothetical protein